MFTRDSQWVAPLFSLHVRHSLFIIFSAGLATLGVKNFNRDPPGGDMDRISAEVFLKEA